MDARRQRAAWAAVTAAGVLLAFAPAVLGVRTLSHRDTDRLYAPVRTLVVEELRAGRLPLWDPYEGTGKPLFAEGVHSVLHPISLAADAGGPRGAARALAGMVPGVLLAGVQLLSTWALLPFTFRGLELSELQKTQWALAPGRLLEWVVPGLFRGPLESLPVGASGPRLDDLPFSESVYLGAPLLVAAALALRGRRRTAAWLGIASAVLLWLALGHHLGARQLLDRVPVWSRFRYSEKLMAPLTLCSCALGALGVDAFGAAGPSKLWKRVLSAACVGAAAVLLALVLAPGATRELATRLLGDAGPFYRSTLAAGLPHLVAGLAALLAVDRLRDERARAAALALLVALAPAAAVYHGAHLGAPEVCRFTTPMRLETDSPAPRIAHPVTALYDHREHPDHVDASARVASLVLSPAVNVAHRVDTFEPYTGFEPRRLTTLSMSFESAWARAFRLFGLTHVAIPLPHDQALQELAALAVDGGQLVQRDETLGFELWAVPHRPWAFFPARPVAAALPADAHRALLELMERGDDGTVVVEAPAPPPTAPGRVLHVERGTDTVRVEAESLGPALLVVQDAFWPGWRAFIDGQPVEIVAADYLVRAVRWPPGRHRLELTYDPPELRAGIALSALGTVLVLLLAIQAAARRGAPTGVR